MKIILTPHEKAALAGFFELIPQFRDIKFNIKSPMIKCEQYVDFHFYVDEDYFLAHLQNVKCCLGSVAGLVIAFASSVENFATSVKRVENQFRITQKTELP